MAGAHVDVGAEVDAPVDVQVAAADEAPVVQVGVGAGVSHPHLDGALGLVEERRVVGRNDHQADARRERGRLAAVGQRGSDVGKLFALRLRHRGQVDCHVGHEQLVG